MLRHSVLATVLLSLVACGGGAGLDTTTDPAGAEGDVTPGAGGELDEPPSAGDVTGPGATSTGGSGSESPATIDPGAGAIDAPPMSVLPITKSSWMATTPGLADRPLNEIVIPGSHDSATYGLISVYDRPANDAFAPDAPNAFVRLGEFVGLTDKWAKAQRRTLTEQLEDGVRALDLRPCRDKSGTLRGCHGLYGPTMADQLQQVKAFADAHPREIIIVTMDGFNGMLPIDHVNLINLTKATLGARLVDKSAADVSPTMTLGDLWANHPGQNVIVGYEGDIRGKEFFREDQFTSAWKDTWDRTVKKQSLVDAFASEPADTFFQFFGQATPDGGGALIGYGEDPLGNYPTSLEALAHETNPVVLGWIRDEWASERFNIIALDFYDDTCLFQLTQKLNGVPGVSFATCHIGKATSWGSWAVGPYGRGAGEPMGCATNEEQIVGLCYPKCASGYDSSVLFPTTCTQHCPSGYRNDGLTCFRDAKIISSDTSACPWYDACGVFNDCSTCPSGYHNDGCTCRRDPDALIKNRYDRGVGEPLHTCDAGYEKSGLLCYPECHAGYHGVGPLCVPN